MINVKRLWTLALLPLSLTSSACVVDGLDDIFEDILEEVEKGTDKHERHREFYLHCTDRCGFLVACGEEGIGDSVSECTAICIDELYGFEEDLDAGCADLAMETLDCATKGRECSDWFEWIDWIEGDMENEGPFCEEISRETVTRCADD